MESIVDLPALRGLAAGLGEVGELVDATVTRLSEIDDPDPGQYGDAADAMCECLSAWRDELAALSRAAHLMSETATETADDWENSETVAAESFDLFRWPTQ